MHEFSLMRGLMKQITDVAQQNNAQRVVGIRIKIGALAHISADHFREHFEEAAAGTVAFGAKLQIDMDGDVKSPFAHDIVIDSVDIE